MIKSYEEWTATMVADQFEEAIRTLRRLEVPHLKPMEYFNSWPEIVYTAWEIMQQDKLPTRLGPPPPDAITRMEKTFEWLAWLEVEERNLIWWKAEKKQWKPICAYLGCGRNKAWRMWVCALLKITNQLNKDIRNTKDKDSGDKKC